MDTHKTLYLYISDDRSEVWISRSGFVRNPLGFSAPIGGFVKMSDRYFFDEVVNVLSVLLDEDSLWHDESGNSIDDAEANRRKMNAAAKKHFKKFIELDVSRGGAGPPGITITGANASDDIRFSFLESELAEDVESKFKDALVNRGWWLL